MTTGSKTASGGVTPKRARQSFADDFRLFFVRGLKALLPTLVTLSLFWWAWNFLWESLGQHLIWALKNVQFQLGGPAAQYGDINRMWEDPQRMSPFVKQLIGVLLAVLLVYVVGLLVGNLIGRTFWKLGESLVMRVPVVRAIYPAVKQITEFVLAEKSGQFQQSRVVACRPHAHDIWSIALVTGTGVAALNATTGEEMVTVFVPSSPTAFTGYVMIVPRSQVVDLPLTVEEAMRMLVSGGVLEPKTLTAKTLMGTPTVGQTRSSERSGAPGVVAEGSLPLQ